MINVLGGARSIDRALTGPVDGLVALGIFRRVVHPAHASIVVGSAVGMGITWEVVVAAEMISGGGSPRAGGRRARRFIWNSYVGGSYEQIVVGMISISIAGYLSSELLRARPGDTSPWLKAVAPKSSGEGFRQGVAADPTALHFRKEVVPDCSFTIRRQAHRHDRPVGLQQETIIRLLAG
jgi:hypothetical protein